MVKRVLIAFDFDHTLIDETIDTYVLRLLPDGGALPPSVQKLYSIHLWNDYQREVFRYLHTRHVTKDQLLSCVAEMPMVKGMRELLEYLVTFKMLTLNGVADSKVMENGVPPMQQQQQGSGTKEGECSGSTMSASAARPPHSVVAGKVPSDSAVQFDIIIVSDANTAIINHILEITGLQSVFSKIYTNPASFDNAGCLHLSPYHHQDWCTISPANMCKGHVLDEHLKTTDIEYDVVAFVGDGENDFCPTLRLRKTDIVFPRRTFPLDTHIIEGRDKVSAMVRPWDTGFDIMSSIKQVLMNAKA